MKTCISALSAAMPLSWGNKLHTFPRANGERKVVRTTKSAAPIDIRRIKDCVRKLPPSSILRELILSEPDMLTGLEFVTKGEIWLKLSMRELD